MKLKYLAYFLILILFSCNDEIKNNDYQIFIDSVTSYQAKIETVETSDGFDIDTSTLNLKEYFNIFSKLKLEPGYNLDFYYYNFGLGAYPVLFAIENTDNLDTILKNFGGERFSKSPYDSITISDIEPSEFIKYADSVYAIIPKIHVEDDDDGYFQFLVFYLIGEKFAYIWHANYGSLELVCSEMALNQIIDQNNDFIHFDNTQKNAAKKINPQPIFDLTDDFCYVDILTFSPWAGFIKTKYSIKRNFPHEIKFVSEEILVEYDCGIKF